jgi:hypothetical protein
MEKGLGYTLVKSFKLRGLVSIYFAGITVE